MDRARTLVVGLVLLACSAAQAAARDDAVAPSLAPAGSVDGGLLGPVYPLEVTTAFPAALLHWLDSLTSRFGPTLSAGKTTEVHQADYQRLYGQPDERDLALLSDFVRIRERHAAPTSDGEDPILIAFFEQDTLDGALAAARRALDPADGATLGDVMHHFGQRYAPIWRDGQVVEHFLHQARQDPRRSQLRDLLARLADFYHAHPVAPPHPRLVLVPLSQRGGTHAQAIGRFLLVEIRPGDTLASQIAPIVHENAHFLMSRMQPARSAALQSLVAANEQRASPAWQLLHEALPTAIAQGVADEAFGRSGWSVRQGWYHEASVDAYAKRIFPLVRKHFGAGGRLDPGFLGRLIDAFVDEQKAR